MTGNSYSLALSSKVDAHHLERAAIVYVRQSHPNQVLMHRESAALQYALVEKAISLGWAADRVEVIDEDQGRSAQSIDGRLGFQRLLAEVSLDHIGIIFGIEMSRLARSNKDWHQLIELCSIFQTLLADQDGLYDPTNYNDRLLLGLKGTMSEAELHILKGRMKQGLWNKARRGEVFTHAPIGYIRDLSGKMMMDPDEQVRSIVRLIFDKFTELKTINGVLQYFVKHDLRLGVRPHGGENRGNLEWHTPSRATVQGILKHPIYAGAYRFGHRPSDARAKIAGRPSTGRKIKRAEECEVLLKDRLPAYISWERYEANQRQLAENRQIASAMCAPRQGPALLSGLITCGICGCRMSVSYASDGDRFRYHCSRDHIDYGKPICQSFQGKSLDVLVAAQVLEALKPASLALSLATIDHLKGEQDRLIKDWHQRLERAQYEVNKASKHYHEVDPQNRLVARELEKSWEEKLIGQRKIKEEYERYLSTHKQDFTDIDRAAIGRLADDIPKLWHDKTTAVQDRQQVIRILLKQVIAYVVEGSEQVDVTLRWVGDIFTCHKILRPVARYEQMKDYELLLEHIVALYDQGRSTSEIARQLNAEGWHPPKRRTTFNGNVVAALLSRRRSLSPRPRGINGKKLLNKNEWWLDDLARKMNMPQPTVYNWVRKRRWIACRDLKVDNHRPRIVIWADKTELSRLKELRAWTKNQGGWPSHKPPKQLTTPRHFFDKVSPSVDGGKHHEIKEKNKPRTHQATR